MLIGMTAIVCGVIFAITGSLTFWPIKHGYDFYIPVVLLLAGTIATLLIIFGIVSIAGQYYKKNKNREKPAPLACFLLREIIAFSNHLCSIHCKVIGKKMLPKKEKYLFVCNHMSNFDPMIAIEKLGKPNLAFITKPKNFSIPWGGNLLHGACFSGINREDYIQSLEVMKRCTTLLEKQYSSIGVYPEGTRHRDGIGAFHEGVFNMAIHSKAPLVIATIKGTDKIAKRVPLPSHTTLEIIKVMPYEEYEGMTAKALSDYTKELMIKNLEKAPQ